MKKINKKRKYAETQNILGANITDIFPTKTDNEESSSS